MGNWTYGVPVPDRGSLGTNVQIDHPVQVSLRIQQRTSPLGVCYYDRGISSASEEQGVLVETGRGLFHTELGKLQRGVNAGVVSGTIEGEASLMEASRQSYTATAQLTQTTVNYTAVDSALLSNQNTLNVPMSQTVEELNALQGTPFSGVTAMTDESINQCLADTFQATPEATNIALQSSAQNLVTDTVSADANVLMSSEGPLMSMEGELMSSESGLMSEAGSLTCEAAGPALGAVGAYFSIQTAQRDFEQGDTVGGILNLSTLGGLVVPEVGMVAAPLAGSYEGVKAGAELLNMQVNCSAIGMAYEMGDVSVDDPRLQGCMIMLAPQIQSDIYQDYFGGAP
jgi:hypothetical protein